MLSQRSGKWETAPLDRPYGRGAMFQVYVTSLEPITRSLEVAGWPLYAGHREVWREVGDRQAGQREILVLDPDGQNSSRPTSATRTRAGPPTEPWRNC
jgi:hypothetical protein